MIITCARQVQSMQIFCIGQLLIGNLQHPSIFLTMSQININNYLIMWVLHLQLDTCRIYYGLNWKGVIIIYMFWPWFCYIFCLHSATVMKYVYYHISVTFETKQVHFLFPQSRWIMGLFPTGLRLQYMMTD